MPQTNTRRLLQTAFSLLISAAALTAQSREWTVVATYTIPGKASGLAFDGSYLYSGIYGSNGDQVYRIDPANGAYQLQFSNPALNDAYGMTWDGQYLWITDHVTSTAVPAAAIQLDLSGNIQSQFNLPDHYMSGIAYDNGDYWVATYYPDPGTIYKVTGTGSVLQQFTAPAAQPWDLCLENGNLWVADYNANTIFKVDTSTGSILESHAAENIKPAGIVYDGTFLWYVDGQISSNSTLYKVDLTGGGTPAIALSFYEHDFGNVILNQTGSTDLTVSNTGSGDLVLQSLAFSFPQFWSTTTTPVTISGGNTLTVPLYFTPDLAGPHSGILTITSNDPVDPQQAVSLAGYGLTAVQDIEVSPPAVDFGNVRVGAHTSRFLTVSNQGAGPLTLTAVAFGNFSYYLDPGVLLPLTLAARDTLHLRCWFNPPATGSWPTVMTLHSNDPDESALNISISGTGVVPDPAMGTEYWSFQSNSDNEKIIALRQFVDLTGDGVREVLVADNEYHVHCLNGNSSGAADVLWTFSSRLGTYWTGSIYHEQGLKVTGDLNGDGTADVLAGTAWGSRSVFALNGRTGEILWYYDSHVIGNGGWVYEVDGKYDFTGDGIPDVLAGAGDDSYGTGPKRVWLFNGTNGALVWEHPFTVAVGSVISIQDATGDGIPEVVCGESVNSGSALVHLLNGANGNLIHSWSSASTAVMALMDFPDINGDGRDEFCFGDFQGDFVAYSTTNQLLWSTTVNTGLILTFDKATDGLETFLIPALLGNQQFPLINTSNGSFAWSAYPGGYILDGSAIGDVSGDGTFDVLLGTYDGSGGAHVFAVYDGTNGTQLFSLTPGSPVEQTLGLDDLDGNGSPEMLLGLRNGLVACLSGGVNGTLPSSPPVIEQVNHVPAFPTSQDVVRIHARVTDDVAVTSVRCFWGTSGSGFPNSLPMQAVAPDSFVTQTPIPAHAAGTTVQYYVRALDITDTTYSATAAYTVFDPPRVLINEIMYNSSDDNDNDWIELTSLDSLEVDLSGYTLWDSDPAHDRVVIPAGSVLMPGAFYTIALVIGTPATLNFVPDLDAGGHFELPDDGGTLAVFDSSGRQVDIVTYDDETPWPTAPDGTGPSLEFITALVDNDRPENWAASINSGGTPGAVNSVVVNATEDPVPGLPDRFALHPNYPNPFNPHTTIRYDLPRSVPVRLTIYDLQGREIVRLVDRVQPPGFHTVTWQAGAQAGHGAGSGIYLGRIQAGDWNQTIKLILVK